MPYVGKPEVRLPDITELDEIDRQVSAKVEPSKPSLDNLHISLKVKSEALINNSCNFKE
jgi:hypothetical protein